MEVTQDTVTSQTMNWDNKVCMQRLHCVYYAVISFYNLWFELTSCTHLFSSGIMKLNDQRPSSALWHWLKYTGTTTYPCQSLLLFRPRSPLPWWHSCASLTVMMETLYLMILKQLLTTRWVFHSSAAWLQLHTYTGNNRHSFCFCGCRICAQQHLWTTSGAMTSGEPTWVATLVTNPTDLSLSLHSGKESYLVSEFIRTLYSHS